MYSRDEPFLRSLECYFGIYFPRCFATREISTKITLSWALKRFITRVHTLFSIYEEEMVVRPSHLYNGNCCTVKTSLCKIRALHIITVILHEYQSMSFYWPLVVQRFFMLTTKQSLEFHITGRVWEIQIVIYTWTSFQHVVFYYFAYS